MEMTETMSAVWFIKGDLVCHSRWDDDTEDEKNVGHVIGFCPGDKWIRVKTLDGRSRIWLKDKVHNIDADMKEKNHAIDTGSVM